MLFRNFSFENPILDSSNTVLKWVQLNLAKPGNFKIPPKNSFFQSPLFCFCPPGPLWLLFLRPDQLGWFLPHTHTHPILFSSRGSWPKWAATRGGLSLHEPRPTTEAGCRQHVVLRLRVVVSLPRRLPLPPTKLTYPR